MALVDIEAIRGDTETYELEITDLADVPVDLTGLAIWFTAKRSHAEADDDAVIRKAVGAGITIDPDQQANPGKATVKVDAADTAGLPARRTVLVYDVQTKDGAGEIATPIHGSLTVAPDVTIATA